MASRSETIRMIIQARDAASPAIRRSATAFQRLDRSLKHLPRMVLNLKTAFIGLGVTYLGQRLVRNVLDTASSFERLQISLDTITKGEGEKYFKELNDWALKMPVNTEKAIDAFRKMRAMGLSPSIDDMTTLVDTMGALGGSEDMLEGIAGALGKMQTKGKVSAQELIQLAERGVPAFEILGEKLGLTQAQLANIGNEGIDAGKAIRALLDGMAERFGGQSVKMQGTFSGLMESLRSYWKEFQRLTMEEGAFEGIKKALTLIVDKIDELRESGKFEKWAKNAGKVAADVVANIISAVGKIPRALHLTQKAIYNTIGFFHAMGAIAVDVAAVVAASLNPYWAVKVAIKGFRETFPVLAEMRDNIDAAGQRASDLAVEAENSAHGALNLARSAEDLAKQIRAIPDSKKTKVSMDVQSAIEGIFANEKALDSFEEKARKAYGEAQKQVAEYGQKVREISDEIAAYKMGIEDRIRNLQQRAMSDEERWLDQRTQAEQKLAAAQTARAEGNEDLAQKLAEQAVSLAESLAREVTKVTTDGQTVAVRNLEQTTRVAERMMREAAAFAIEIKEQEQDALNQMISNTIAAADEIKRVLDDVAEVRTSEYLIEVPRLEEIERRFVELSKTVTKKIIVETVEKKAAGGPAGFASGGKISGWGGGDKIRALLERGEFVIRKEAVRRYGAGMFAALNAMKMSPLPAFATGGFVGDGGMNIRELGRVELSFGGRAYPVFGERSVVEEMKSAIQRERLMKGN